MSGLHLKRTTTIQSDLRHNYFEVRVSLSGCVRLSGRSALIGDVVQRLVFMGSALFDHMSLSVALSRKACLDAHRAIVVVVLQYF